ncbi:Error-prone DNA polymerase [BD1-7 clade bacterium]|uniref:Error-prone DNA polymerase n=1 Tax=BD1-7 clade bacterium TaxID=2029982 RepID=A0A5S9QNZ0_9GAMM|nr:Error-prone DNA polymerase [BD1-7 clade bacterium]
MYAELHCKSHYSFLTGASSPEELVYQAHALGYEAIAITDECSYAGIVKAFQASEDCGLKLIVGSEFLVAHSGSMMKLLLLAPNRTAYSEVSALITLARRRSKKGEYELNSQDLQFGLQHCLAIWVPQWQPSSAPEATDRIHGTLLKQYFRDRIWLGVECFFRAGDQHHYLACSQLADDISINMVAMNDVHMHCKSRKPLQDTLTAIRRNTTLEALGQQRHQNAEKHLKSLKTLKHQYPQALLDESLRITELCDFSMRELKYQYPQEVVPAGESPIGHLARITWEGAHQRYPQGIPEKVHRQVRYELDVIESLQYEYYFLTIYDIVAFARKANIYCQGRGSAANSAVCYCLMITEVDPDKSNLLFERFISKERNEPPDIDVDFENARREEVIQYIYQKYSRKRTALTATVTTYRRRSAIRDVGKALGLADTLINELSSSLAWWDTPDMLGQRLAERNLDLSSQLCQHYITLVQAIIGIPRHLSQHVGGFLITQLPTSTLVPIENAAMEGRTVIQWDKYDIEILGLLKVDILALGMLSALHKAVNMIQQYQPALQSMQDIPREDPAVYDMLCRGDSIGVFQVESRAQISMLPRLKPRCFYDLVIEVAIVRPGPIQGDMVHPYLKRRNGEELASYPNDEIKTVLERTLGVPIFQEQVIQLTMVAAGFSGGEADQLRRAMASWGKNGNLYQFRDKLIEGMLKRGYDQTFAERLFEQMKGFGSYGFPESHSASFAILVYFSSWVKCHHPHAFYCALLNSQPMGFYSPSQLVQDAQRHHVTVLPVCVNHSHFDHQLVSDDGQPVAIRLGFRLIKGFREESAGALTKSRKQTPLTSLADLKNRKLLDKLALQKLIDANALQAFSSNRREAYWQALEMEDPFFVDQPHQEHSFSGRKNNSQRESTSTYIKAPSVIDDMVADYHNTGLSLDHHPMQLVRERPPFSHCTPAKQLLQCRNKSLIEVAGVVTGRQRPGTAGGTLFLTLEDETGNINVVIWQYIQEYFRQEILRGRLLYVKGTVEIKDNVVHVIAGRIEDHSEALPALKTKSRNFH